MRRLFFGLGALLLVGASWNTAYEGVPAGTDQAADLDLYINGFKEEVRQRLEVEHIFGGSTDDNGLHQMGSARCFVQATAPTDISGGTAALGQYNSAAGSDGGTALTTDEVGAAVRDLGAGRCWVDTDGPDDVANTPDDYSVAVWNEALTPGWVYLGTIDATAGTARFLFDPGKYNLLYNGSFEATDGTGAIAATAVPAGWTDSASSVFGYAATPAAQGDGVYLSVTAAGADEGITRTLGGLKASTTYYAVARAQPVTSGDECFLLSTGGGTNLPGTGTNRIATGTSWATVSGFLVTDATPTDVVFSALTKDGDVCRWDHIALYETSSDRRGITQPGIQAIYTTDIVSDATIDTTFGNNAFVSTSVVIPGPGYIVLVDASVSLNANTNDGACMTRLVRDDCAGGAFTAVSPVAVLNAGNYLTGASLPLSYVDTSPVSGGTCIYRVEVREDAVTNNCEVNDTNMTNNTVQSGTSLRLLLMPAR